MKYKLDVPYMKKDQAKSYGARWDPIDKIWYFIGNELPKGLEKWYTPATAAALSSSASVTPVAISPVPEFVTTDVTTDVSPAPAATPAAATSSAVAFACPAAPAGTDPFKDYKTVTEVVGSIKSAYRTSFSKVMVKGEVTNYQDKNAKTIMFSLKDENSILHCKMWKNVAKEKVKFQLCAGKQVAVVGNLELYEAAGLTQVNATDVYEIGAGAAALALEQLKARLEAEGLFNVDIKKPIPKFPKKVGIVTSKNGQARQDIEKVARKRNPYIELFLYDARVQGENAVPTLVMGIRTLDQMGFDTIIVGRGGGSDEELGAFNDEQVVRAVFEAKTPIISAVGHQGNYSLTDLAADLRVATPSEAAEMAVPDVAATINRLKMLQKAINDNMRSNLQRRKDGLKTQKAKLEGHNPVRLLKERQERLKNLTTTLDQKILMVYRNKKSRCELLIAQLHGLSPTAKLVKGFGYITVKDEPVVSVSGVNKGDELKVRIHDGVIVSTVSETVLTEEEKGE